MVLSETLRERPFFIGLSEEELNSIGAITQEKTNEPNTYMVEMTFQAYDSFYPGEPFSISELIGPYRLTSTAHATYPCCFLKIDAEALRALCNQDHDAGCALVSHAAKAAMERLHFTRVQLAAASA